MIARSLQRWAKSSPYDLAGAGALAATTILFMVCVVEPIAARRHEAAARQQDLARQAQRANVAKAEIALLTRQIDAQRRGMEASRVHLLPVSALNERLSALVALAGRLQVDVQNIQPGATQPQSKYLAVPIRVTGRSGFPQCVALLREIGRDLPDLGVADFSLRASADNAGSCEFDFNLTWLATVAARPAAQSQIATAAGE